MTVWDFSTAVFNQSVSISAQDTVPTGIFFRADGLKMYHIGDSNNRVYEYDLSVSFDISTLLFNQSFGVGINDVDLFFKPDGLRMFILDANFGVVEYNLSVAWDISTAVIGNFKSMPEDSSRQDIFFRNDGLIMYMIGSGSSTEGSSDRVYRYNLSTAWDVTTAIFNQSFHVIENLPTGIFFKSDGLRMFVTGAEDNSFSSDSTIWEYPLTVPWDISSTTSPTLTDITSIDFTPRGSFFQSNGSKFYHVGLENDSVYEYILAVIQTDIDKEFEIDSILVNLKEKEFIIDANIAFKKTFTIDVLIPITNATNGTSLDALLEIQISDAETFFIDGITKGSQEKLIFVSANIREVNQTPFFIDGVTKELDIDKTFTIDALTVLSSVESVLFVESVIGRGI